MNHYITGLQCTQCQHIFHPYEVKTTCPLCGDEGILDVLYDYKAITGHLNAQSLSQNHEYTMFRYREILPIEDKHIENMLKVGWTPLYHANRLHHILNIKELYIKDDGLNPSGSLKDRASAIAVLRAIEENNPIISCSSTGNAASSLAANAARMGLKTYIFVPKRAPVGKLAQLQIYGSHVIMVDGDYKDTYDLSKKAIDYYGWYNRNAAINPYLVEGKKTVALEIAEQLHFKLTDWVVVSVGDGCTIAGVYKGFYDFKQLGLIPRIPKLLGVQSEGCNPLVKAFHAHSPCEYMEEKTLADSISVGVPRNPIKALHAVTASQGTMIDVSDQSILDAMQMMGKYEGIFGEPAAATTLAGLIQAIHLHIINPEETVTIINTGNGLKDPQNAQRATGQPVLMKPDIETLIKHIEQEGEHKHEKHSFWTNL